MKTYFCLWLFVVFTACYGDETFKVVPDLGRRAPTFRTSPFVPTFERAPAETYTYLRDYEKRVPTFKPISTPFVKSDHGEQKFELLENLERRPLTVPSPIISASKFTGGEKFEVVSDLGRKTPIFAPITSTPLISVPKFTGGEKFSIVPGLQRRVPAFKPAVTTFSGDKTFASIPTFATPITKNFGGEETFSLVADLGRKTFVPTSTPAFKSEHIATGQENFKLVDSLNQKISPFQPTFAPTFNAKPILNTKNILTVLPEMINTFKTLPSRTSEQKFGIFEELGRKTDTFRPTFVTPIVKKKFGEENFQIVSDLGRKTFAPTFTPVFKSGHVTKGEEKFSLVDSLDQKITSFRPTLTPNFTPGFVTPITKTFGGEERFEIVGDLGRKTFGPTLTPIFKAGHGTTGKENFGLFQSLDRNVPALRPTLATTFNTKPIMNTECVFPPLPALTKKVSSFTPSFITEVDNFKMLPEAGRRTVEPIVFPASASFPHTFQTPTINYVYRP